MHDNITMLACWWYVSVSHASMIDTCGVNNASMIMNQGITDLNIEEFHTTQSPTHRDSHQHFQSVLFFRNIWT